LVRFSSCGHPQLGQRIGTWSITPDVFGGFALDYEKPEIRDQGTLVDLTAGCVGGVPNDALAGDPQTFPAASGVFCE
jgi:hypothetical protein